MTHAAVQTADGFEKFMVKVTENSATVGFGSGGTAVVTSAPTALGGTSGWTMAEKWGVGKLASGSAAVGQVGEVALAGGKVPVTLASTVSKAGALKAFGKAVGALAGGPLGLALFAVPAVMEAMQAAGVSSNIDPNTGYHKPAAPFKKSLSIDGYTWWANKGTPYQAQAGTACAAARQSFELSVQLYGSVYKFRQCEESGISLVAKDNPNFIAYMSAVRETSTTLETREANWDEVRPDFESADFDLASLVKAQLDAREKAQKNGIVPWPTDVESTKVTGPATIPPITETETTTRTVVGPDGITRTEEVTKTTTTTRPVTYTDEGVKVQPSATTTTTTKLTNPDGSSTTTTDTETTTKDTDKPASEDKETDLCVLHPEIIACAKLGDAPDAEQLPKAEKTVTFTPVAFQSNATCPAGVPIDYTLFGRSAHYVIPFEPLCNAASTYIRPLLLLAAALVAAGIFVGGLKA
ncbi:hypothetical protein RD110_10285 [Rhodoferax koreense]|uniref:TspB protein n=1 Tax=Rhodoferax koreensis TaxID=1842727 RepID=A0A1P8JUU6_9BURK|nr:hypothetical protein RD110_10285 [Rhodoferax koreense]